MAVTRDTMRAGGLTVGEALERDGAFLRSMGFKTYPSHLPDEAREEQRQVMRENVLGALDDALGGKGWIDEDLPALFRALDEHFKRWETRQE